VDRSIYASASDVPYSFAPMLNGTLWPDGLAALETDCVQNHSDIGQTVKRKTRRFLQAMIGVLFRRP
jgi:hypothetical protein